MNGPHDVYGVSSRFERSKFQPLMIDVSKLGVVPRFALVFPELFSSAYLRYLHRHQSCISFMMNVYHGGWRQLTSPEHGGSAHVSATPRAS